MSRLYSQEEGWSEFRDSRRSAQEGVQQPC